MTPPDLDRIAGDVDCIYMTRIQKERFHDPEDYKEAAGKYILTPERVGRMKPDAIIMHPLPRRYEIEVAVDKDPRAAYWRQERCGMWIRAALITYIFRVDQVILDEFS